MLEMMTTLLSYFEEIAHMSVVESMYLCGFVALYVGMSVVGANIRLKVL